MERQLVRQGNGGVTLTLPIKWIRKNQLSAGKQVLLHEKEGGLLVRPKDTQFAQSKVIVLTKQNYWYVRNIVTAFYTSGVQTLKLVSKEQAIDITLIHKVIGELEGIDIIAQSEDSVTLHCYIDGDQMLFETLILKVLQSLKTCANEIKSNPNLQLSFVEELVETRLQQKTKLLLRILHQHNFGDELTYWYSNLIRNVEYAGLGLHHLYRYMDKRDVQVTEDFDKIVDYLSKYISAYNKKDYDFATDVHQEHREFAEEHFMPDEMAEFCDRVDGGYAAHFFVLSGRLHRMGNCIACICAPATR